MKKKLFVLITMLVGTIFNVTAAEFSTQEKRVAILPFSVKGNFDALYAEVAQDNFTTELIKGGAYRVVERSQLDKAMKELKFQSGNDFDESSAMEVGKLAGAEIVVIGIVTALRNQIVVNIRGISVKTGIAEFAEREFIRNAEDLLTSVEKIAKKLSNSNRPDYTHDNNISKYREKSEDVDFSLKTDSYHDKKLSKESVEDEKTEKFIQKFFYLKLGIDPYDMSFDDIRRIFKSHKRFVTGGVHLTVWAGVTFLLGGTFLSISFVIPPVFIIAGSILLAGSITMGSCAVFPFLHASKIRKAFRTVHGESLTRSYFQTFKRASANKENNSFEVALLGFNF